MKTAMILLATMLVGCATCTGCRGGLFGGRQSPDQAPHVTLYEVNNLPGSHPVNIISSNATQAPNYHAPESVVEANPAGVGAYQTTPAMGATTTTGNATTGAGKYTIVGGSDATKRATEADVASVAQLLAGNTGSQATQTPAQVQRQGTATPTSTSTATPTVTETDTVAIPISLAGQGNPLATAQAAGPGSAPVQTLTPAAAAPAAPAAAELQAQYDEALTVAKALGTGGGEGGVNTPAQAAAQARLLEAERALQGTK